MPTTERLSLPCGITLALVGDEEIRAINRDQRGIDQSTDVLSFPTVNYPSGVTASGAHKLIRQEYSADDQVYLLGDIIISKDHVLAQAKAYGHSARSRAVLSAGTRDISLLRL